MALRWGYLGLILSIWGIEAQAHSRPGATHVDKVLKGLSLKHKVGQMVQLNIDELMNNNHATINQTKLEELVREWSPGSLLNSPFSNHPLDGKWGWTAPEWKEKMDKIQDAYMNTPGGAGVPMFFGIDSVHGAIYVQNATVFPQQINVGASFNPELAYRMGEITAKDTRQAGMHWAFTPILGIATQPKWPRVYETFGEDPLLSSVMGADMIKGMQGFPTRLCAPVKVAACMKHFVGYPNPRSGHDRSPEWIPDRLLYQYYVPSFFAAIKADVATAMESYNELNGIPMVSSEQYLKRLLRDTLKFEGMTVTDWREIENLNDWHKSASTPKEAVRLSMERTSIDMSMVPSDTTFAKYLVQLVEDGVIPEARIDESARRVLQVKYDLGLLQEQPDCPVTAEPVEPGHRMDRDAALHTVRESVTLLRNQGNVLPFNASQMTKLVVTGPCADSLAYLAGGWTFHWQGALNDDEFMFGTTILGGIKEQAAENPGLEIHHVKGCGVSDDLCNEQDLKDVEEAAESADAVLVCAGEPNYTEKPGNINDLLMNNGQRQMMSQLGQLSTPMVLVLVEGRPRGLSGSADGAEAVLHAFLPGPEGGQGIAEVLFGKVNPSGHMPISYPKSTGNAPVQYWRGVTEDEAQFEFEFGDGLSFTEFTYTDLHLDTYQIRPGQSVNVEVTVTNTGGRSGKDVVLMYLRDEYRVTLPEVKILKGFQKTALLGPGEHEVIHFVITCDELAFVDVDMKWVVEPGKFTIMIGNNPGESLTTSFTLKPAHDSDPDGVGNTIPWPMWGQPAGHQLPLPVDLQDQIREVPHVPVTLSPKTARDVATDVGFLFGGIAVGVVSTLIGCIVSRRAQEARHVKAQAQYLEMDSFTIDDPGSSAIAPAPPEFKGVARPP